MKRVVDVSEYTTEIPFAWWEELKQNHQVEGAIIQAWGGGYVPGRRNEHLEQHAEGALRAHMDIDFYVWPPSDWALAMGWVRACGLEEKYHSLYLDVEADAGVDRGLVDGVAAAGKEPRIYASPNSWQTIMGNTQDFAHLKLWLARYAWAAPAGGTYGIRWQQAEGVVQSGSLGAAALANFQVGGWSPEDVVGWQFAGTTAIGGETCDQNLMTDDAFQGEDGEMFTPEDREVLNTTRNLAQTNRMHQAVLRLLDVEAEKLERAAGIIRAGKRVPVELKDECIATLAAFSG